jgi:putative ABC transport system substrate-binding protein
VKRRDALLGIAALSLAAGRAYSQAKIPRVGVLRPGSAKEAASVQREPFERGLRELGWTPGSNVLIDYRYAEGDSARLPQLAAELVRSRVDVIVAASVPAIRAARQAGPAVPIVMAATNDPIAEGLVQNLSRPGGNLTGIALLSFELDGKRLELLKDTIGTLSRLAVIANPTSEPRDYKDRMAELRASARSLKVNVEIFEVRRAEDIADVFATIERRGFDALMVRAEPRIMDPHRQQIVAMAAKLKLPAIYFFRFYVEAGGLMSYGESIPAFHQRSASYVSRILKGANAGELAIERPTKFELTVNLKAAKALGFEIPKAILFRADEVIQ